ncbi:MAG: hypothetical protein HWN65_14020 [Candidatus Helarchaeota archaeon]|nr:hypothetical protein [Candidatus Helarchaeota archaeon]
MKKMKRNGRFHKSIAFVLVLILFTSVFQVILLNLIADLMKNTSSVSSIDTDKTGKIQSLDVTETKQWITNPNFNNPPEQLPWNWTREGDISDVEANTSANYVNYKVVGNQNTTSIIATPPLTSNWINVSNPDFPVTPNQGNGIDSAGCWASHNWDENTDQTGNTPSIEFKRNITLPVNMSDYTITSANVSAIVNATVAGNIDTFNDGLADFDVGDYIRFYVEVSDLDNVKKYEVAYNKTWDLGTDAGPLTMGDTYLVTVPEDVLIFYLTSALGSDDYNFTITLGIFIYCEDNNPGFDLDTWTMIRIKSFNLSFSYEKNIDRNTYVEWYQVGNKLPSGNVGVDFAKLEFQFKIDQDWTTASPNSEVRIWINTGTHSETVKLSSASTSFQDAKSGGFDVTSLISIDVNITLYLRVFLADNFNLDRNFTISIDNVLLDITYTIYNVTADGEPYDPMPLIIGFTVAIIGMVVAFLAYQLYFKYPKLVRKIRSTRKTIDKGKTKKKPITVNKRDEIIQTKMIEQQKILEGIQHKGKIMGGK